MDIKPMKQWESGDQVLRLVWCKTHVKVLQSAWVWCAVASGIDIAIPVVPEGHGDAWDVPQSKRL